MYLNFITYANLYEECEMYIGDNALEMYVHERGWQEWMEGNEPDEIVFMLETIYGISKMDYKALRERMGINVRAQMARDYRIKLRTLEDWESGRGNPPEHVKLLLSYTVFMHLINEEERGS